MALNPYDNCPCGSGKKLKWCCAPYFERIQKAFELQQQGQHETAIRSMESLVSEFPDKPQILGFYANLLFGEEKIEKAEEILAKAFTLDPNFPMGHLLRGILRQQEGELIGALMLFRKAADAYPPDAHEQLSQVYELIARNEVTLNRPVASRAAMERAVKFNPADAEMREQYESIFGEGSRLPNAARKAYSFRKTVKPPAAEAATGKYSDAKRAYEQITQQVPEDPAGWFNLGLVRAWLGEQPAAVEALNKSIELEWDDAKVEEAAALVEVLRCGQGMDAESDYLEHRVFMQVRDPETVFQLLQVMSQERKILAPQMDPNGQYFSCFVVEELPNLLDTGTTMARVMANMTIAGGMMRLWHTNHEAVRSVAATIRDRVNLAVGEPIEAIGPSQFGDLTQEAIALPVRTADVGAAEAKIRDRVTKFFEEVWIHRPLKALGGAAPLDAGGSPLLRKRLLGIVRFWQDCVEGSLPQKQVNGQVQPIEVYDFNRLRHKLGAELQTPGEAPKITVREEPKKDFTAMSAADLAGLSVEALTSLELEDAIRAALKLDAKELAVKFAKAGAAKPTDATRPDRYPFFACIIAGAIAESDLATALKYATEGAAYDAAHNHGKRANEYAIRSGQLQARSGHPDAAEKSFDELIARHPDEPKFYITATESMLSTKQGSRALKFAELGLAKAKSLGNRDLEGACHELADAARKQMK